MTAPEKTKLLQDCIWKLKRAAGFAEAMSSESVRDETACTLQQLTTEAAASVNSLRSIAVGNPPPKVGG